MWEEQRESGISRQAAAVFEYLKTLAVLPAGRHSKQNVFGVTKLLATHVQTTPQDNRYLP